MSNLRARDLLAGACFVASVALAVPGASYPITQAFALALHVMRISLDPVTSAVMFRWAATHAYGSPLYTVGSVIAGYFASRRLTGLVRWLAWIPALLAAFGTLAVWFGMFVAFG